MVKKLLTYPLVLSLLALTSMAWGAGYYQEIKVTFPETRLYYESAPVSFKHPPFLYHNTLYVPLRELSDTLGMELIWNGQENTVQLKAPDVANTLAPANSLIGEDFVYGQIMKIDYINRSIDLEQHLDNNSREIFEALTIAKDAIILIGRNQHYMQVSLEDLRAGDVAGIIISEENTVRGIIVDL